MAVLGQNVGRGNEDVGAVRVHQTGEVQVYRCEQLPARAAQGN